MAIAVTHAAVATIPDDPGYEVGSNEWNAPHVITGMGSGTTTIDFGVNTQRATVTVTGQTGILAGHSVEAFLMSETSVDHSAYEHEMAALVMRFTCGNIVPGTGFDIIGVSETNLSGIFTVRYRWQ